jgi:hypothetical protein
MEKGQIVSVRLYGGEIAPRRVLLDRGNVVVICSEEEFQAAQKEEREPSGLGFPRQDVIIPNDVQTKKIVSRVERSERARAGD